VENKRERRRERERGRGLTPFAIFHLSLCMTAFHVVDFDGLQNLHLRLKLIKKRREGRKREGERNVRKRLKPPF
jgi:hypothetical protein